MIRKIAIGSVLALAMAVGSTAFAATIGPHSKMQAGDSLIQQIQYHRWYYCRNARYQCRLLYGFTRRYFLCLHNRGC